MSGGISVRPDRPTNAWRQRGYEHGQAGREKTPPPDPELRAAYLSGYRSAEGKR